MSSAPGVVDRQYNLLNTMALIVKENIGGTYHALLTLTSKLFRNVDNHCHS